MDDNDTSSPLVTESDRDEHQSCLEETIEKYIGDFGWSQLLQVVIVSFVWIFDAQQAFISIFTDAQPTWHCVPPLDGNPNNWCDSDICLLPKNSWSWDLPLNTSFISEWSLECAGSIISSMPTSSFYLGSFAGGFILVGLADSSFGRKNTMLLSCLVMSLAGILATVSTNIWVYSTFRFISGFGRANIGTCSLVLSSELVGKRWRGQTGTAGYFMFTVGFLSLPVIAYLNKESSWRVIYLWTCIPAVLYCFLVYFLVKESPRWLFVQGRKEDFVRTLKSIAPTNKANNLTLDSMPNMSFEQKLYTVDIYSAIKKFFERKWAIHRLVAVMILGFGVGLVYYGVPLGVGNLDFDIYLSTALNALVELPAAIITFIIIGKSKRRIAVLGFSMLCAISSLMCALTSSSRWKGLQVAMELMSFFSVCTVIDVLLIYTLELFPTCIRNSAVTIARQMVIFGGATSPLLVAIGRGKGAISYSVFGLTIGICGLFVGCLPETRGETLCDTMDEEESKETRRKPAPLTTEGV